MSKITKRYETRLETLTGTEIIAVLDAKLAATSPERVVDYVGLAIDNLNATIERFDNAAKDLKALKDEAKQQIDIIKAGTAIWMSESGVDSLSGDIVSSMKIVSPAPLKKLVVTNEEALINLGYFVTKLDSTAVKKALENGEDIDGAEISVTHREDSVTVYKKR